MFVIINRLSLHNFRNIKKASISLQEGINVITGDNAQGKTSALEAIYMCATGRSQRTRIDNQLILFGEKEAHIKLEAMIKNRAERIDIHIKEEGKKGIAMNGVPIHKLGELFGLLQVIIFSPEDLQLIKYGPSERRRFMDMEICQYSNVYYYDLQQYYKVLKQRNNLLKEIQKKPKLADTLFVWDMQLVQFGVRVIQHRERFIRGLSKMAEEKHRIISGGTEMLQVAYKPNTEKELLEKKLYTHRDRDLFIGSTSVGPHKDDILFSINGTDAKTFSSQGQQRTAALSLKLAEISYMEQETGSPPILLLDDVFSELDGSRQTYLMQGIEQCQTIITCTGIDEILNHFKEIGTVFSVTKGEFHISA